MARVSAICRADSFARVRADYFVGGTDVPVPPRRTDLHHAMVFARRVSLVPMALRGRASDVVHRAGPRRYAGRGRVVVRKQSDVSLAGRDRARHGLLHDSKSDRPAGLQLSSCDYRLLDLRAFLELDRNATSR